MGRIDKRLLVGLAWRQLFFLVLIAAIAGAHFAISGEWIGWPAVLAFAVLLNILWCFVA